MGRSTRNFFAKNDIVLCVPGRPEHIGTDLTTLPCIQTRSVDMDMYNTYSVFGCARVDKEDKSLSRLKIIKKMW